MLHGQKIIYVALVDQNMRMFENMSTRIWEHEKMIKRFLKDEVCLMGRLTFDLTRWRGPKSWVITRDLEWKRYKVGTIHNIDDLHLHSEGDVYVLGGTSLFYTLESFVDEVHLFVLNSDEGLIPWIRMNMEDWKPGEYTSKAMWSYCHLIREKNSTPHKTLADYFDFDFDFDNLDE